MKYKHNLYTLLILFCAMLVAQNVVAQGVTGDKYNTVGIEKLENGENGVV